MMRRGAAILAAAAIYVAVFGSAFALGPRSCDGGFGLYVAVGAGAIVLLLALPFVARSGRSRLASIGWSLGFAALGLGTWIGGFGAANFRILCRLF